MVGGETFVAYSSGGGIDVFDADGNLDRHFPDPYADGLGGGSHRDNGVVVTVAEGVSVVDANHGFTSTLSALSGVVNDQDNLPQSGVTVYLDANQNDVLDTGETTATTDALGEYTFEGIAAGDYVVRQVAIGDLLVRASASDPTRLFIYTYDSTTSVSTIHEIDPASGEEIDAFPSPVSGGYGIGMAMRDGDLYVLGPDGIHVIDADSGTVKDVIQVGHGSFSGLAILDDTAYIVQGNYSTTAIRSLILCVDKLLKKWI